MEYVPAYRAPIYDLLATELDARGIDFALCIGDPPPSRAGRNDAIRPAYAEHHSSRFFELASREVSVQAFPKTARQADLVIVQQEAGLALNYVLAVRSFFGRAFAVWGHGEDPNASTRSDTVERAKGWFTRRSHWAFAYTARSKGVFEALGMPADRITVLNNSIPIDVGFDRDKIDASLQETLDQVAARTGHVGWFVSSMDEGKNLPHLLDTVDQIRSEVPDFEFMFLGDGDERPVVTAFCAERPWAHDLGSCRDDAKALAGSAARLMIMPAAVGLHVLDAFAFGTPLITADGPSNSHELDYLEHKKTGYILPEGSSSEAFARVAIDLLHDEPIHQEMCDEASISAKRFGIHEMVQRFAGGIAAAAATSHEVGKR